MATLTSVRLRRSQDRLQRPDLSRHRCPPHSEVKEAALDESRLQTVQARVAKRKQVGVADLIYEAIESFIAKCEAEAELETKIIKFRRH